MLLWDYKIPSYLTEKKNTISFVLFTAVFALIFINVYSPFGSDKWLNLDQFQFFLYSSLVVLIGVMVIAISRIILYVYQKNKNISYKAYALWITAEIFSMSLVYSIVQYYNINIGADLVEILKKSVKITALVLLPSYVFYWLYVSLMDKYKEIELLKVGKGAVNQTRQTNTVISQSSMIPFHDEKGVMKFSIKREDLLYIESDDNYIVVHYTEQQKVNKFLIRNTLKRLENEINGFGLIRCHRSFMVNFEKVKVIKKSKDGMLIEFDNPLAASLPVSKTYVDQVVKCFYDYSQE